MRTDPLSEVMAGDDMAESPEQSILVTPDDLYEWDVCASIRTDIDDEAMTALKDNISANGIQTPIWVCPTQEEGKYLIIAGYRRVHCARELGMSFIPAIVKTVPDPQYARFLAIIENTSRDDLSEIDNFRIIDWLGDNYRDELVTLDSTPGPGKSGELNVSKLARFIGRSEKWVRRRMTVMKAFTADQLKAIGERIKEDRKKPLQERVVSWNKVFAAVESDKSDQYRQTILEIVLGDKFEPQKDDSEEQAAPSPLTEVAVRVKAPGLDRKGVGLRFSATRGSGVESVVVRAQVEMPFKIGRLNFTGGTRGDKKTSELFEAIGKAFLDLATLGLPTEDKPEPEDRDVDARVGIKEALDAAHGKLAEKTAS